MNSAPTPDHAPLSSRPLSVAFYSPGWPPDAVANGIVTYIDEIAQSIRKWGHQARILTRRVIGGPNHDQDVIELDPLMKQGFFPKLEDAVRARLTSRSTVKFRRMALVLGRQVEELVRGPGLDLIELEESFGWAAEVTGKVSVPVIVRLHGPWFLNGTALGVPQDRAYQVRVDQERLGIARASAITSPSHDVLNQTRDHYQLPLEEAEVIPNPIDPVPKDRQWKPGDSDPNLVTFIGRFDRHKGGDLLIDAFARVLQERPATRLRFVGPDRGCLNDQGKTRQIEEYIHERIPGALESGKIEWLGQQPHHVVDESRRQGAITVVASRYENFPYSAVEALAMGCPQVASNAGGIPEIVEHEVSGLLFQSGNTEALASTILRALDSPEQMAKYGVQAAEQARLRFAPEVVARQTIEYYRRVLEESSRGLKGVSELRSLQR